ncbi:MAG: membrane protein insertase YidC, partial [Acidobacteriota bacterium]
MDNRRLLLAAFLSLIVVAAWGHMQSRLMPAVQPADDPAGVVHTLDDPTVADADGGSVAVLAGDDAAASDPTASDPTASDPAALDSAAADAVASLDQTAIEAALSEIVTLVNDQLEIELDNRGAVLRAMRVRASTGADGEVLDLVRRRGSDDFLPLALATANGRAHPLNDVLWTVEASTAGDEARFRHRSAAGDAEKTVRLQEDGLIAIEIRMLDANTPDWSVLLGPDVRNPDPDALDNQFIQRQVAYRLSDGEQDDFNPKKLRRDEVIPGFDLRWVTFEDNYFVTAFVPILGVREVVVRPLLQRVEVPETGMRFMPAGAELGPGADDVELEPSKVQMLLLRNDGPTLELKAYAGAKYYSQLAKLPYDLRETVRWGFFGFLARPLYYGLEWVH